MKALSMVVENAAGSIVGEYGSVIFKVPLLACDDV
jgi:hypothetical protein